MRNAIIALALLSLAAITACSRNETTGAAQPVPASDTAGQSAIAATTVGGVTLQTSTVAVADINETVAARYGIDRMQEGLLLLVTVRDAVGDAADPGDLQLSATVSVLPEPPKPLELRAIHTEGMTDYIGVLHATPPASVQFRMTATRSGARADIATTAELYPR
ncbi:DUF4426 domain-containing protein [Thermomonas sp. HDW16]|uniref:DUF4426 domain-containing protein n=1 Tax=Thermomonas sp. HDW16 TaxID=2714945 RepID=UPI00140E40BA|nr:DUF4426 domain-containing protein [Thermomonas sp. HDW16]QIL20013.1 DUF4426 domain-containing protein [Thermomonas sp. HDW16]